MFPPRSFVPLPLFLVAQAAFAQTAGQSPKPAILDSVIVTATRSEQDVFSVPYTAHVIGRDDFLGRRAARTLPEALAETPGVMIQKTSYGQASPFIRGFTGFRTLMLIDGIRLNNATFREGPNQYWSTIDLLSVDRLDVVKGPSSVLYGSDAIGGTVNAITRTPQFTEGAVVSLSKDSSGKTQLGTASGSNFAWSPGAFYRYASAENSHTARGELSLSLNPQVGFLGGATYKDFDDLRGGRKIGLQENSGYHEIDGDVKLVYRPLQGMEVTAAFQRVEQNNVPRTHATVFGTSFDGTTVGNDLRRDLDQERNLAYLQLAWRDAAPWLEETKLSLSFHRQSETTDRVRNTRRRELTGFTDDQYGLLLGFRSPSPLGKWSYGLEYYHDEVDSFGRDFNADGSLRNIRPRGPVADDASYDLLGVYLQNQFQLGSRMEITAGVRYSYVQAQAGQVDTDPGDAVELGALDKSFDAFTASIRARFDLTKNWNLFGGVSQGFRAPNLSDFTSFDLARSGELETPAPDLKPEHYLSYEIGSKARIPSLKANVYGAFFHTRIEDQISRFATGRRIDDSPEITKNNVGDGFVQGVEFGADWNFYRQFTLFGNLTWAEGEVDTLVGNDRQRHPSTRIQPLSGLVGLRWNSVDARFWLEAVATLARRQDRLSPGDVADTQRIPPGGTGGYSVYTVRAGWNVTPRWNLTAALENFTNEDYRIHGSGINEPGTNAVISSRLRF
jgi:hemoglobin/transferrin/lactoferrin receptor protein